MQKPEDQKIAVQDSNKNVTLAQKFGFSDKQMDLIKRTVAKNATDDELELFFYRCKQLDLNPLLPGQVYFLKFGNNPGSIIIGLDGFRDRAHKTGELNGIKRGKVLDQSGKLIGAWAEVFRKGVEHSFREEVPLSEYHDKRKQTWQNMPETMIKKVAEVAALRMAFPAQFGSVYLREEFDRLDKVEKEVIAEQSQQKIQLNPALKESWDKIGILSKEINLSKKDMVSLISERFNKHANEMLLEDLNSLIEMLEQRKAALTPKPEPQAPEDEANVEWLSNPDTMGAVGAVK